MKKILLISVLLATVCFAEDTYAEHEAKMQQMQSRTGAQDGTGSGEQKKYQYRKGNDSAGSNGPQDGTGNQYKGSNGGGGGGRR